jgi:hypothetical protein
MFGWLVWMFFIVLFLEFIEFRHKPKENDSGDLESRQFDHYFSCPKIIAIIIFHFVVKKQNEVEKKVNN